MKSAITILLLFISASTYSQKIEVKRDTLIITEYEKINFIKIADKIYKIKIELEKVKPMIGWTTTGTNLYFDTSIMANPYHGYSIPDFLYRGK